jgi:hypothetical protein
MEADPAQLDALALRWCRVHQPRDHASGTPRVRPSDRPTHMLSSSNLMDIGEMVIDSS